jgi:hypothetical protein
LGLCRHCISHQCSRYWKKEQEKDNPEDPEGSEGSTVKEGTSAVNLSAENNENMTDSGKADAQNGQNAVHPDANFTQEKAADTATALIKPSEPSEPSANLDRSNNSGLEVSKSTIFRLGHSDTFGCNGCKQRGDK